MLSRPLHFEVVGVQRPRMLGSSAIDLMLDFAERTGVTGERPTRRYLWTDAFAVCNFLTLDRIDLAETLIEQVHQALGRHRPEDARRGWLSGLPDAEGRLRPTAGGLRIGKPLPERRPDETYEPRLEWERDGQYFHYLTKWMHALDQAARATGQGHYNVWARELAAVAHDAFVRPSGMAWKMSIDLSRPLVAATGQHDPIDGYLTAIQLDATAQRLGAGDTGPPLAEVAADYAALMPSLTTDDPLGLGGLLADAWRTEQLSRRGVVKGEPLRDRLLEAATDGVAAYAASGELRAAAERRLGFRELGLAIGLAGVERMAAAELPPPGIGSLIELVDVGTQVITFWSDTAHRESATWLDHRDINEVMLATARAPAGFLDLNADPGRATAESHW